MRIEVAVMMQVHVPDDANLDDLSLQISEDGGIQFISNGQTIADASQIEDYYIDDIESDEGDRDEDE
ncbi:hypothetical protein [uncultured Meiothermus sp.]|jgi:hypothetical protein|uniref:hypothetical protein n=1 Tax=uncultured Meiothermus sp. TaxID=157471 RepID=UPI00260ACC1D|nr:hypothetical protein [uncultured Meiothermus sp.]